MKRILLATLVCTAVSTAASAHHSQSMYDQEKRIIITGTVTEWKWINPHAMMELAVADGKGGYEMWSVELRNPGIMSREGLNRDDIQPGSKITMVGWPARDGHNSASLLGGRLENGHIFGAEREFNRAIANRANP